MPSGRSTRGDALMPRLVFSSDQLPAELDERARFALWRDVYVSAICKLDLTCLPNRPFFARSEVTVLQDVHVGRMESTVIRFTRTAQQIAADPRGNGFFLTFNRGDSPLMVRQLGRELSFSGGSPALSSTCESGDNLASACRRRAPCSATRAMMPSR
jgi:hypothetical protein